MGRFENRPENPRARGEISRAAETALWGVVEDLQSLQQNMLKSLQEDISRLESDKKHLADEIKRLQTEKEQLQQTKQITEQQALVRQLAQVLANHISSQLQSSLSALANQAIERDLHPENAIAERRAAGIASHEANSNIVTEINKNTEQLIGSLDDTLTITLKLLQQELNNHQSGISQQLSRMQSRQQQGEAMLAELTNRLNKELEKKILPTPVTPTKSVELTVSEQKQQNVINTSPAAEVKKPPEPISVIPKETSTNGTTLSVSSVAEKEVKKPTVEPTSVIQSETSRNGTTLSVSSVAEKEVKKPTVEPTSVIQSETSSNKTTLSQSSLPVPEVKKPPEPTSVPKETSSKGTTLSQSSLPASNNTKALPPEVKKDPKEPISVLSRELSDTTLPPSPPPEIKVKPPEVKKDPKEPISVLSRELSDPTPSPSRQPQRPSRGAGALSPMQMGLLLILLSTVLSSLYNVAIKAIFQPNSLILGAFQVEQLISPTLGNSLLILMLRMMVVVPLMLVLAPMMHQRVWQDLHSLAGSVRGNPTPSKASTRQVLILSVVSGCFLFLSQLLIYLAIGQVPTGMAIALFFIYPMISGLLSWFLFRDQPTLFRISAIAVIFIGELLMLGGSAGAGIGNNYVGSMSAIASGVSFAIYVILTRICAAKLHPVTFTLINFATMLCLCFIGLMLPLPTSSSLIVDPNRLLELILSAFILGVMTLASYVLNNVGISKVSATRAAIFGASVPVLTVIFAGLIIQETLSIVQALGVLLITFGAAAFSLERIRAS
ncbi:EamA family transporter [Hassallia byssoidea VB512170]|uniref:EamA family transporter n=1 Tax=Hassallia byssoidea VB512170 TaxID=1304833 RepID=A0A846HIE8_9CYAN|nr:EamA family transporter [Hassalia byssoidea]NEU77112.1 EamA family transporter [Hassalia byssoidea VB512170]